MPIITSFPDTFRTYNRVEVNWADIPIVTSARVLRVNTDTGECAPLRPYMCFDGDYLALSCGHGVFWDTEVPLDTPVYYITDSPQAPCLPAGLAVQDDFARNTVAGLGSAPIGGAYSLITGAAAMYSTTTASGGLGLIEFDAVSVAGARVGPAIGNTYLRGNIRPVELATGARFDQGLILRATADDLNRYEVLAKFETTGAVGLRIVRTLAGVTTIPVDMSTALTYTATSEFTIIVEAFDGQIRVKIFNSSAPEPVAWDIEYTETSVLAPGQVGIFARIQAGNTNIPDFFPAWAYLEATDLCQPCTPVTVETLPSTMASNGVFRLKDPVRPCHDQAVPLCFTQANTASEDGQFCIPGSGIFFASMSQENYPSNSVLLNPVNAALPISISRARRGASSTLQLVTRTFDDRDAILTLNAPGSPLLLQAPPAYGIADRYMAISSVEVDRGLTDHRFQVRIIDLPHIEVARPAGPMQGPCGSQFDNLCDIYDTWQELNDSGLTWEDLIRGRASTEGGPGPSGIQTWDDVQATYVDWDAAQVGNTWIDIEQGT